ncbi:MAG: phytanoyl-CoA dioxygenase family protein [Proteobacteria bacterium]|nr:phytanoyl-CoA dioxygenase family protein [Pseudomonadota bacterium]
MSPVELKQKIHELCEQGFVHIPGFVPKDVLGDIQKTVHEAFYDTPYGRDERTGAAEDETRLVGLGTDVDVMPVLTLPGKSPLLPLTNPDLQGILAELLGEDYYLDRATVRRARANSDRFYYHKDQHGDIGLTVLLNDLGVNAGATSALPRRHLGTPPTLFAVKNINAAHPDEVQMTGKAGDAYLFYRDIDHSRAENLTADDNVQMIYAFVNKNTQPASNNRQCLDQNALKDLPLTLQQMLRPYDGVPAGEYKGFVEKFLYGSGFTSPGAGDYDVRNDLFRDFLYTMFFVRGKTLRNPADQSLPRNTTKLNEIRKVTFWQYVRGLSWWLVFRSYVLAALRKTSRGEAAIHSLKKVLGRA